MSPILAQYKHNITSESMLFTFFASILCLLTVTRGLELNVENSVLLNCPIRSQTDLDFLETLRSQGHVIDIFDEKFSLDEGTVVKLLTTMATSEILLSRAGCYEEKGHSAVRRLFEIEKATAPKVGPDFHDDFRSYQNIIDQLNHYASLHPQLVKTVKSIGKSHEGRELYVIHISGTNNNLGEKPLVWVMSGQHAREWISISSVLIFIEELLNPVANPEILDNFEFAIMPVVNPDGYEYSRTSNRMWRKNRNAPYGVDLNRNWDHRWNEIRFFRDPRRDDYSGAGPASEPEVSATQNYILSLQNRFIGFDIHSYGQLILRNYGWTRQPSPHEPILATVSNLMADSILKLTGVRYAPIPSAFMYITRGSAEDWLYVKAGIPGFLIELRDKGLFGFKMSNSQIRSTGMELYTAIITGVTAYARLKQQQQQLK